MDGAGHHQPDRRELLQVRRKKFGMVFQNFALLPHRTVLGNIEYGLEVQGVPRENAGRGRWKPSKSSASKGGKTATRRN